jgi:hypothetical protein
LAVGERGGRVMTKPPHCIFFRPLPINPDVCARYVRPLNGGEPFCLADEECESRGLKYMPRADDEEDSFE